MLKKEQQKYGNGRYHINIMIKTGWLESSTLSVTNVDFLF